MDIGSASLTQLLREVAADQPAPGAGAAAGVALALAAACACKALRISGRRLEDGQLASAAERAEELARRAVSGAQSDCEDFPKVLEAPRDGRASDQLRADGEASLEVCNALRTLIDTYAGRVAPELAGDMAAALHLLGAAERITERNLAEL